MGAYVEFRETLKEATTTPEERAEAKAEKEAAERRAEKRHLREAPGLGSKL
jgi:hypothetical protein